jgi:hypothetical protein
MYGTYLAACVLYGSLYAWNPVGNPYWDRSMTAELGVFFQQMAADSLGYK